MLKIIPPKDADRLAKLAWMFTSPHDGEVVNALRIASRLLCSCGLTWRQMVNAVCANLAHDAVGPSSAAPRPYWGVERARYTGESPHMDDAGWALQHLADLSKREARFLQNMARLRNPITPKQREWRNAILEPSPAGVAA